MNVTQKSKILQTFGYNTALYLNISREKKTVEILLTNHGA